MRDLGPDEHSVSMNLTSQELPVLHPTLLEQGDLPALLASSVPMGMHGICSTLPSSQRNVVCIK